MGERTEPPAWLELVDLSRIELNPGDTLLVKPTASMGFFEWELVEQIEEHLRHLFPEEHYPGVRIAVLGVAADVGVLATPKDGA
jgi:hypothetical protein